MECTLVTERASQVGGVSAISPSLKTTSRLITAVYMRIQTHKELYVVSRSCPPVYAWCQRTRLRVEYKYGPILSDLLGMHHIKKPHQEVTGPSILHALMRHNLPLVSIMLQQPTVGSRRTTRSYLSTSCNIGVIGRQRSNAQSLRLPSRTLLEV